MVCICCRRCRFLFLILNIGGSSSNLGDANRSFTAVCDSSDAKSNQTRADFADLDSFVPEVPGAMPRERSRSRRIVRHELEIGIPVLPRTSTCDLFCSPSSFDNTRSSAARQHSHPCVHQVTHCLYVYHAHYQRPHDHPLQGVLNTTAFLSDTPAPVKQQLQHSSRLGEATHSIVQLRIT